MDTSHYAALKIGRRSETGREKRVTPKFGEYRRRKFIPPPNSGRYTSLCIIIDSGCTNHMTRNKKMFTSYVKNKDSHDTIIFGDGNQDKVKGIGKIAITTEHSISNVFLVESFGYNLLSVSQLCHMGYNCLFTNIDVTVFRRNYGSLAFKGVSDSKLYLVDFTKENANLDACLLAKTNMG
jgi:hypothetical protein